MCLYTSKNDNAVVLPVISLCFTVKRKRGKCKNEEKISSKAINIILDSELFLTDFVCSVDSLCEIE